MSALILCPAAGGLDLARRIAALLPGSEIQGRRGRVPIEAGVALFDETTAALKAGFAQGRPLIALCAAGIVIRALAPLLGDKTIEPPVLAIGEDGGSVVPLLGGHRGGNDLARRLAEGLGAHAAVTTAGDLVLGLALDDPPAGWRIKDLAGVKPVAAALISGGAVRLSGDAPWLASLPKDDRAAHAIAVSHRLDASGDLIYRAPRLALGVGTERGASGAALIAHAEAVLAQHGLAKEAVALVASIDLKADEAAVHDLARHLGVPARFFSAERLNEEADRLANPSETVRREVGCPGVSEGAALAAVGPAGALLVPKVKGERVTCAVGLSPVDLDPGQIGKARGKLFILGIGPGDAGSRTADVSAALRAVDEAVGYGLYLDLVEDLIAGKPRHATDLGAETARARRALELAAEGKSVALVCSGDAGIYALATLVFELMDRERRADWRRLEITVLPGVSAMQTAAARLGAPLGHDFCAISLSDLLTPWAVIEKRLRAAAAGDFVIAFYNPRSDRRGWQLGKALEILREARPPSTPVALARNLGRPGEQVTVTDIASIQPEQVDMLTLVMVGGADSRRLDLVDGPRIWTPRGYAAKEEKA
jgi:cobalt-precorrin 5A hydrolase/precorrin-3B C17-methyltransferase